jgi:hypothetical protein
MKRQGGVVAVCAALVVVFASVAGADVTKSPGIVKAGNFGTVATTYEAQNSPQDKLVVQVTAATQVGDKWVSKLLVIWGDLDELTKGSGKQYYSPWPGYVDLGSATGKVIGKYHFNQGGEPRVGTGIDKVITASGSKIEWKAAVVGCYDGLLIEITSDTPETPIKVSAGSHSFEGQVSQGAASPTVVNVTPQVAPTVQTVSVAPVVVPTESVSSGVQATTVNISLPTLQPTTTAQTTGNTTTAAPSGDVTAVGIQQIE